MILSSYPDVRVSVPDDSLTNDVPLVAVMRGNFVGSLHRGSIAVVDANGTIKTSLGNPADPVFLRSAAKPFQAMPAVLSGGLEKFDIGTRELAVLCSSHSAEPRHQQAVLSVLQKIGLDESALRCGIHPPLHEKTARAIWRAGGEPTPVCNNCSGAHAGMLLACKAMGWSTEDYGDIRHPLQQLTLEILGAFSDVDPAAIDHAIDNCSVPAFRLPLANVATAFARLATGTDLSPHLQQSAYLVRDAMTAFPEMVAGEGRFDTDLMQSAAGTLVSKGGAEAFQGAGSIKNGWGVALKISDGSTRAVAPAMVQLLDSLDLVDDDSIGRLESYRNPIQRNWEGEVVGSLQPVFKRRDPA